MQQRSTSTPTAATLAKEKKKKQSTSISHETPPFEAFYVYPMRCSILDLLSIHQFHFSCFAFCVSVFESQLLLRVLGLFISDLRTQFNASRKRMPCCHLRYSTFARRSSQIYDFNFKLRLQPRLRPPSTPCVSHINPFK